MNHPDDSLPDFCGKLVLVELTGNSEDNKQLVYDAHFERQGGRLFLVGTIPPNVVPGFGGAAVAVAWDNVSQYVVVDSLAQYRDGIIAQQRERSREKWRRPIAWIYGDA